MAQARTPADKLLARMTDMEHQEIEKTFFGLFYGDKGVRKTTTAQYLAQKLKGNGRILFVDSAEGWVSLDNFPKLKRSTDRIQVDDPRDLMVLSRALRTRAKGYEDYSVVILDEYSSWWQDTLHAYAYEKAGKDPATDELPEIDWTWYGPPQQAMMNVLKNFQRTEGLHVIIISHEQGRAIQGEKNGPQRYTPLLGTKLSAGVGQLAHVVARFESRKVGKTYVTEAQVQPTRYVEAKTRIGGMEVKEEANDLVELIAEWINDSEAMAEDLAAPEANVVADEPEDDEDEDFAVEDDEQ